MAEEKKKRIVIASVLKPSNDTRMFGKMAVSLARTNQYEVHVIGYPASPSKTASVVTHELPLFDRISLQRIAAPWRILKKTISLKPSLLIITTHELLWIAVLAKLITSCKLIYDVQENYFLNILHTHSFPPGLRLIIAVYVRLKEVLTSLFVDHFLLAEAGYEQELRFTGRKKTLIENKVRRPATEILRTRHANSVNLLFSGTLAESTGVFTAIELAIKLHAVDPAVNLTLIGYCSLQEILFKIINTIEPYPYIKLIGGQQLVPHDQIVLEIMNADFGIISYPNNPSTASSIPTKLYEYLGYHLPIILVNHPPWVRKCVPYQAAIVFDPQHFDPAIIHQSLKTQKFYTSIPNHVYWETEEGKLRHVISRLLSP
jgi:hypothetical protein